MDPETRGSPHDDARASHFLICPVSPRRKQVMTAIPKDSQSAVKVARRLSTFEPSDEKKLFVSGFRAPPCGTSAPPSAVSHLISGFDHDWHLESGIIRWRKVFASGITTV